MDRELLLANLSVAGLALGGLLALLSALHLLERASSRSLAHQLGWRAVLVTGWLGVPLHELSHLLAALLFRHRIIAWSLFDPDPVSGTLGYVRHAYSRRSAWQLLGTFFIGIAPVVLGALAIAAIGAWMLPASDRHELLARVGALSDPAGRGALELAAALAELVRELATRVWSARSALLPLQLYLLLCVTCHLAPSRADLLGALPGGQLATGLLALGVLLASGLRVSLAGLPSLLAPLLLLTLSSALFQLAYVALTLALLQLTRRRGGRTLRGAGGGGGS